MFQMFYQNRIRKTILDDVYVVSSPAPQNENENRRRIPSVQKYNKPLYYNDSDVIFKSAAQIWICIGNEFQYVKI